MKPHLVQQKWCIIVPLFVGLLAAGFAGLAGTASATSSRTLEATYTAVANGWVIEAWLQ